MRDHWNCAKGQRQIAALLARAKQEANTACGFSTAILAVRASRADRDAFRRLMTRAGGEPPQPGDELPAQD